MCAAHRSGICVGVAADQQHVSLEFQIRKRCEESGGARANHFATARDTARSGVYDLGILLEYGRDGSRVARIPSAEVA